MIGQKFSSHFFGIIRLWFRTEPVFWYHWLVGTVSVWNSTQACFIKIEEMCGKSTFCFRSHGFVNLRAKPLPAVCTTFGASYL